MPFTASLPTLETDILLNAIAKMNWQLKQIERIAEEIDKVCTMQKNLIRSADSS